MKFISKNSNLRIVLSPGIQSNQLSGIAGKPGVYVKFQNGIVDITDETLVNLMVAHSGFGSDFIAVGENGEDPFAGRREENEPVHVISTVNYGHVEGKKISPNAKIKLDPQIKKLVDDKAMEIVNQLLPKMVKETIEKMMAMKSEETSDKEADQSEDIVPEEVFVEESSEAVAEEPTEEVKAPVAKTQFAKKSK